MIVWGGQGNSNVLNTAGLYDPVANSWTATTIGLRAVGTLLHTAVWTGSKMIVWGGYGTPSLNDGGLYDPVANTWTATTTTGAPSARGAHTAVWTGSRMIVWGGVQRRLSERRRPVRPGGEQLDGDNDVRRAVGTPTATQRSGPARR